jgi:hypothetical protein
MTSQGGEIQLELRIDLATDPITGSLSSAQGAHRRFSGWIALASALESMRADGPQHAGDRAAAGDCWPAERSGCDPDATAPSTLQDRPNTTKGRLQ